MNPRHIAIAIVFALAAFAILCAVSIWLALIYFVCALVVLVLGGILVNRSPIDPPWAEETPWFNCPKCDYSFTKDGQKAIIVPKPCAPMELCPRCRDEVKGQVMGSLENYFHGGKEQFVRRN